MIAVRSRFRSSTVPLAAMPSLVILSAAKNPRVRPWQGVRSRGFFAALRMTNCGDDGR
jgi:hypothetical protein